MNAGPDVQRAYSNYVLRPIMVVAALCGVYFLFHRSWLSAGSFLATWFFISVIGHDLAKPSAADRAKSGRDETYLVAKGVAKTTLVLFFLIAVMMVLRGTRWYFAIPEAWLLAFCAAVIPAGTVAWIVGYLERRKMSK